MHIALLTLLACSPSSDERVEQALAMAHEADDEVDELRDEVARLREEVDELSKALATLRHLQARRVARAGAEGDEEDEGAALCQPAGDGRYMLPPGPFPIDSLDTLGRALPHRDAKGDYDGFRVSAIRRGTLADSCGLNNGDVIHSINGQRLDSMESALAAYTLLEADDELVVKITRRGEPTTVTLLRGD